MRKLISLLHHVQMRNLCHDITGPWCEGWFKNEAKDAENWKFTAQFRQSLSKKLYHSQAEHQHAYLYCAFQISSQRKEWNVSCLKTTSTKIARVLGGGGNLWERKRLNQFFNFHSSPPCHYERNFLVEKKINVCDSSFNFPVFFPTISFRVLHGRLVIHETTFFFVGIFNDICRKWHERDGAGDFDVELLMQ